MSSRARTIVGSAVVVFEFQHPLADRRRLVQEYVPVSVYTSLKHTFREAPVSSMVYIGNFYAEQQTETSVLHPNMHMMQRSLQSRSRDIWPTMSNLYQVA